MEYAQPKSRGEHLLHGAWDVETARRGIGRGQLIDATTRFVMGAAFEQDFSQVRVHTDATANAAAQAVHARAYTSVCTA